MKLTIFGATGGTGRHLLRKALDAGHEVTAYVRTPSKLVLAHERLTVVPGELNDAVTVASAVVGADVVLSSLGAVRGGPPEVMEPAARSIVAGMEQHGVKRLIWATGAGVADPLDQPALMNKIISLLLKLISGKVLQDSIKGVEIIKTSDLDWVITRCPMLSNEPGSGKYRVGYVNKDMGRTLSRENFADFMLKQIESDEWLHKMPAVSDL